MQLRLLFTEKQANNTILNNNASVLNTNNIPNTEENTVLPVEVVKKIVLNKKV